MVLDASRHNYNGDPSNKSGSFFPNLIGFVQNILILYTEDMTVYSPACIMKTGVTFFHEHKEKNELSINSVLCHEGNGKRPFVQLLPRRHVWPDRRSG